MAIDFEISDEDGDTLSVGDFGRDFVIVDITRHQPSDDMHQVQLTKPQALVLATELMRWVEGGVWVDRNDFLSNWFDCEKTRTTSEAHKPHVTEWFKPDGISE